MNSFCLFSGSSHPQFAEEIAEYLKQPLGKVLFQPFPDQELFVQIRENVRGRDVFLIQSIAKKPNDYLMELLIMVDALRRASAKSIVAVIPYFGYGRQDRKDLPRVPITAKLVANLLTVAGVTRVLTMDLHAGQIQGFFDIPVDNLYARPALATCVQKENIPDLVVVASDLGAIKIARAYANHLGVDFAVLDKRRISTETVQVGAIIGDIAGKNVLLVDDMCSTGGTLVTAAKALKKSGAEEVYAVFTHPLLVKNAVEHLQESPIKKIFTSNTVALEEPGSKIEVVSVSHLFAEALKRIILAESISSIFHEA